MKFRLRHDAKFGGAAGADWELAPAEEWTSLSSAADAEARADVILNVLFNHSPYDTLEMLLNNAVRLLRDADEFEADLEEADPGARAASSAPPGKPSLASPTVPAAVIRLDMTLAVASDSPPADSAPFEGTVFEIFHLHEGVFDPNWKGKISSAAGAAGPSSAAAAGQPQAGRTMDDLRILPSYRKARAHIETCSTPRELQSPVAIACGVSPLSIAPMVRAGRRSRSRILLKAVSFFSFRLRSLATSLRRLISASSSARRAASSPTGPSPSSPAPCGRASLACTPTRASCATS